MPPPSAQPERAYAAEGRPASGEAAETYRQWLHLRLGHTVVDDLMSPDQAIVWHELCRELRLGAAPLADDADEAALAEGLPLEAWLKEPGFEDLSPLWLVGSTRAGVCTLVQELLLGLCGPRGEAARELNGDALPVPLVLCGRTVRGPLGMLGMDVRWDSHEDVAAALSRWWALVERDVRRGLQRGFFAAELRSARPLVVIGGLDELPAEPRAAVARWVCELCAAGWPLLVTTRTTDVPELLALQQRGRLRRAFVQPLARPAIDRFVARWSRLPGEFEPAGAQQLRTAIDGAPSRLALARRPTTLAMLAVLVARDCDGADSLAQLERRLLACLDRGKPAHRLLMARVVADRDSPLPAAERATWLSELVALGAFHDHPELGDALGRDPALAEFGGDLLLRAAQAWAEGACPIEQVQRGLPEQTEVHHTRDRHHDDEMARLATLGRRAGWWKQEHAFALRRGLPPRERLFDVCAGEIRPRPLFVALSELQEVWGAYALPLLRAAPLGYVLSEGGAVCPVASAALFSAAPPAEVKPVRDLFHRAVLLELALVSLAADDDALQAEALDLVLSRDLDLDAALDRAMLEMLGEARPAGPAIPEGLSERIAYIDGALELASRLTPCGAPGLVADLERARRLVTAGEGGHRLRRLAAFVVVLLLYCIGRRLIPVRQSLQRGEVEALMTMLGGPETVAAAFPEDRRAQVAADWQWVTRQQWAPHRVAETLLLHMQESVSLAPEQVLSRCHNWLRAFLGARR